MASSLTQSAEWSALAQHFEATRDLHMRDLFKKDEQRFSRFSLELEGLLLDYSKNRITVQTIAQLLALVRARGINAHIEAMFLGEKINFTEKRAALHVALRHPRYRCFRVAGQDLMPTIRAVLERMTAFATEVRSGKWRGYSQKPMTDVVCIGIGGSELGPHMVYHALRNTYTSPLRLHFVSNVDSAQIDGVLRPLSAETTLFIIASKTFTTQETLTNAKTARAWFLASAPSVESIAQHFVAISSAERSVLEFGIDLSHCFALWDWVGGRYSIWSAIGLPVLLAFGPETFDALLDGGHAMDQHFRYAPLEHNMPVILAILGIWYINFYRCASHLILPYNEALKNLPAYIQQLDMESNGKQIGRCAARVDYATGPCVWGGTGINGQHAFYQALHQGTAVVPLDFICALGGMEARLEHQDILIANLFAQSQALMQGKTAEDVQATLRHEGYKNSEMEALAPHRQFEGNRPSNMLLLDKLDARQLGKLIALYEHKIFVQGVVWGINSFDQWGVELGKQLAQRIYPQLKQNSVLPDQDCSTRHLIAYYQANRANQ